MPTYQNQVEIKDLDRLEHTIAEMAAAGKTKDFASAWLRLHELFARYLAEDTPDDRRRIASLWANHREDHDFFWWIREEPLTYRSPDQSTKRLLVGGLHFHTSDGTWSINT